MYCRISLHKFTTLECFANRFQCSENPSSGSVSRMRWPRELRFGHYLPSSLRGTGWYFRFLSKLILLLLMYSYSFLHFTLHLQYSTGYLSDLWADRGSSGRQAANEGSAVHSLAPVQPPIAPPYQLAVQLKRSDRLANTDRHASDAAASEESACSKRQN